MPPWTTTIISVVDRHYLKGMMPSVSPLMDAEWSSSRSSTVRQTFYQWFQTEIMPILAGFLTICKISTIVDDSIGEPLQSVEQSMPNSNCLLWPSLILLWCLNNRDNCASYKVYFCPPLFLGGLIELHMLTSRKWCPLEVVTYVTAHSEHMQLFLCHSLHQRQARIQDFQRKGNWKLL